MPSVNSFSSPAFPGLAVVPDRARVYPPLDTLVREADTFLKQIKVPTVTHLQFLLFDIPFQASKTMTEKGVHLCLWATLGFLPFSAESAERRHALVDILSGAHYLSVAKIGVDEEMKIVARGDFILPSLELPSFIFVPLIAFWQEAKPFIKLIGDYL
jgi:hypothetical protein